MSEQGNTVDEPVVDAAPAAAQTPPAEEGPAAAVEQQDSQQLTTQRTAVAYEVQLPDFLPPSEHTNERLANVQAWGPAAPAAGIPQPMAQAMLDAATDIAVGLGG